MCTEKDLNRLWLDNRWETPDVFTRPAMLTNDQSVNNGKEATCSDGTPGNPSTAPSTVRESVCIENHYSTANTDQKVYQ